MKTEYSERGLFHAVHNTKFTNLNINKNVLKAETTALFVKDKLTNRFIGKEFHIVNERKFVNGKIKNTQRIIRVNAPLDKQRGVLHHIVAENRRFEGDTFTVRHSVTKKLDSIKPTSKKGNYALGVAKNLNVTRKFVQSGTLKTALASETVALKIADIGTNKLDNNARAELDNSDTGKTVLSTITAVKAVRFAHKTLVIKGRIQHDKYKSVKKDYKIKKSEYKDKLSKLKDKKLSYKLKKQRYKAVQNKVHNLYGTDYVVNKKQYKFRKKNVNWIVKNTLKKDYKSYKKEVKTTKYARKVAKKDLTISKPTAHKEFAKYLYDSSTQKISKQLNTSAGDNDVYQALHSLHSLGQQGSATIKHIEQHMPFNKKKRQEIRKTKLHKKKNSFKEQESKLKQKKAKKKKQAKKTYKKPTTQQIIDDIGKSLKAFFLDFSKFSLKFVGFMTIPILIIVMILFSFLTILGGIASNSDFILGTYPASDIEIEKVIKEYTHIAYEYNKLVMQCQNENTYKQALQRLGFSVNNSNMPDTPDNFIFGKNHYQNYEPVYDYDPDKLIAFMSAYYYNFSSQNNDIELWTCSSDYKDILRDLFDEEYDFEMKYINNSHWQELEHFDVYPSTGNYWLCDELGTMNVYSMTVGYCKWTQTNCPAELQEFTSDNKTVVFNLNSGEVMNKNQGYGKTGYYIQNVYYQITDSSGQVIPSFYAYGGNNKYYYKSSNDEYVEANRLIYNGNNHFDYAVSKVDVAISSNNQYEKYYVRDYRRADYITECSLYTNVKQLKTFDEAIKSMLQTRGNYDERLEYYNTLISSEAYGNHQTFISPVPTNLKTMINNNYILNYYGYDMREWNKIHCSNISDCHNGIDFIANTGTNVFAMYDGRITEIDNSKHTITITANVDYWYLNSNSTNIETKITYVNITKLSSLIVGNEVKKGDVIGTVDNYKHCANYNSNSYDYDYIEISISMKKAFSWQKIDPYFLIYRE